MRDKSRDFHLVGTVVADKYKVLDVLGQGGFGTVYLVEITAGMVGQRLALKILPEDLSNQEAFRAQFLNEIRVAMRLVDRNIVQIRDVGVTEAGLLYYTMDFCPGTTLAEILRREGRLPVTRALLLVLNALRALQAAHAAGIIHRDLKPANIMVEEQGGKETVRVLDFGIATAVTIGSQKQKGFAGSPAYMPPEQFLGEGTGFATDIYAIGVILYECLTGRKPYPGSTPREVFTSLKTVTVTPPAALAPEVRDYPGLSELVLRCLEKNPERRFQSARELFDAVNDALVRGTTLESAAPPASRSSAPPPSPQRTPAAPKAPPARAPARPAPGPSPAVRAAAERIRRQRAVTSSTRRARPKVWPVALGTFIIAGVVVGVLFHQNFIDWWRLNAPPSLRPRDSEGEAPAEPASGKKEDGKKKGNAESPQKTEKVKAGDATELDKAKKAARTEQLARTLRDAEAAADEGDWQAVANAADRALRLEPTNGEALRLRGIAAVRQKDYQAAEKPLRAALAGLAPGPGISDADRIAFLALAETLASSSPPRLDEAESTAASIRSAFPRSPDAVEVLALVFERAGKGEELRALLEAARAEGVDSARIQELYQRIVAADRKSRQADADRLLAAARAALAAGDAAKALPLALESLATFPSVDGDLLAAACRVELADLEDGERAVRDALERAKAGGGGPEAPRPPSKDALAALEAFSAYFAACRALGPRPAEAPLDGEAPGEDAAPSVPAPETLRASEAGLTLAQERIAGQSWEMAQRLSLRILLARGRIRALESDARGAGEILKPVAAQKDPLLLEDAAQVFRLAAHRAGANGAKTAALQSACRLLADALQVARLTPQRRAKLLLLAGLSQRELGNLEQKESYYRDAIESFSEAEKLGLRTIGLYEGWSGAYEGVGNLIAAASCLRQLSELDPTPQRCLRAVDAYREANPETARELLRECKERFPQDPGVQGRQ